MVVISEAAPQTGIPVGLAFRSVVEHAGIRHRGLEPRAM